MLKKVFTPQNVKKMEIMSKSFSSKIPNKKNSKKYRPTPIREQIQDQSKMTMPLLNIMNAMHGYSGSKIDPMTQLSIDQLSSSYFYRGDDAPEAHITANKFKTPKSYIEDDFLIPTDVDGDTTPAQHIDGNASVKGQNPYTSLTTDKDVAQGYGKKLIQVNPDIDQIIPTPFLLDEIDRDESSELQETAVMRTQPAPKNKWHPDTIDNEVEQKKVQKAIKELGLPQKDTYTFKERAKINTLKDQEVLGVGKMPAKVIN